MLIDNVSADHARRARSAAASGLGRRLSALALAGVLAAAPLAATPAHALSLKLTAEDSNKRDTKADDPSFLSTLSVFVGLALHQASIVPVSKPVTDITPDKTCEEEAVGEKLAEGDIAPSTEKRGSLGFEPLPLFF